MAADAFMSVAACLYPSVFLSTVHKHVSSGAGNNP